MWGTWSLLGSCVGLTSPASHPSIGQMCRMPARVGLVEEEAHTHTLPCAQKPECEPGDAFSAACQHSTGPRGKPGRFGCHKPRTARTATNNSVRFFLNHFGTSSAISSSKSSGSLLGMFSICFMLILIKEFETEQTVHSR